MIALQVFVALLVVCFSAAQVLEFDLNEFPKDLVALHMPCEESNMFATKCMCHLICTDNKCTNARNLCSKYSKRLVNG